MSSVNRLRTNLIGLCSLSFSESVTTIFFVLSSGLRDVPSTYFENLKSPIIRNNFHMKKSWCTVGFDPLSKELLRSCSILNYVLTLISFVCLLVLKAAKEKINTKQRKYFDVFITNKFTSMKTNIL